MAHLAEVNGIDHFIIAVVFVTVEIFGLAAVACDAPPLAAIAIVRLTQGGMGELTGVVEE